MAIYNFNIRPVFKVNIGDGQIKLLDGEKERYRKFLLSTKGNYELVIQKPRKKRSSKANAYYWAVVLPIIADYMGEPELETAHEFLKSQHAIKTVLVGKKVYKVIQRTSRMTTQEFSDYLEKVSVWASQEGLVIPLPDKDYVARGYLLD